MCVGVYVCWYSFVCVCVYEGVSVSVCLCLCECVCVFESMWVNVFLYVCAYV